MKFIHYIEKVSGIQVMGLLSLTIFFLFFAIMLTWVFRTKKAKLTQISRIPLDN